MTKKTHFQKQNRPIIISLIVLLILVVFPLVISYSNFYPFFVPKGALYLLDSFIAEIPLIPKTSKQVITRSLMHNRNLASYSLTTNISLDLKKTNLAKVKLVSDINSAGSLDSKSKNKITGIVNFLPDGQINIETTKIKNSLAFKITAVPASLGLNLDKLKNVWYEIDLKTFQEGLAVNTRNDQQIIDDVRNSFDKIQTTLTDQSIFSKVTSFKQIKLNNSFFWEIKFALGADSFKDVSLLPNLKMQKPVLTLWIDSSSFYLTKLDLSSELISPTDKKNSTNSSLTIHLTSELSNIDNPPKIMFSEKTTEIKSPIDLALKLTQSSGSVDNLFEATKIAKNNGENFLTVERLLSVILLLPKAL